MIRRFHLKYCLLRTKIEFFFLYNFLNKKSYFFPFRVNVKSTMILLAAKKHIFSNLFYKRVHKTLPGSQTVLYIHANIRQIFHNLDP